MTSFVLDPALVTMPDASASESFLKIWIHSLEAWAIELSISPFDWRYIRGARDAIDACGQFPTFVKLREIATRTSADVNIGRINQMLNGFIRDDTRALRIVEPDEYLVEFDDDIEITPDDIIRRNHRNSIPYIFSDLFIPCLACMCLDKSDESLVNQLIVVTLPFDTPNNEVIVRGRISYFFPECIGDSLVGESAEAHLPCLVSPDRISMLIDGAEIYDLDDSLLELEFVREVRRRAEINFAREALECVVSSVFVDSLSESAIRRDSSALRKLLRVASAVAVDLAQNMNLGLRPVRTSKDRNARQVTRESDGAALWRLTITTEGEGWRLHYWSIPGSAGSSLRRIEFFKVLQESDPI